MKRMSRTEKKEIRAQYREAKKAYRKSTRARRVIVTICLLTLCSMFLMGLADSATPEEVVAMQQQVAAKDIATLPDTYEVAPEIDYSYDYSEDPWTAEDNSRILFFAHEMDNFASLAGKYNGVEEAKVQVCICTAITSTGLIECTAPDGALYSLENLYNANVGDEVYLCFLLSASAD